MSGERLELVRDFSELKAGMLVVVKCYGCKLKDRGMLMSLDASDPDESDGVPGWSMVPSLDPHIHEDDPDEWEYTVGPATVESELVYRVVDDADKAETT